MGAEGTGLEELRQQFKQRPLPTPAGLEEADFLEELGRLYQRAMEAMERIDQAKKADWTNLKGILDQVDSLQKPADIRQNEEARFWLDQLEIFRLEMFLSRSLPESWQVGSDISGLAEDDLRSVLLRGDLLLKEKPPPNHQHHQRQIKTFQAKAAMILAAARLLDDEEVERIITDPDVPRGNAAAFLHQLWWARFVRDKGRRRWPNLPHPAHTRALAYGLIDAMMPENQYLHPNDNEGSPDSLLQFLQEEKDFTQEMLGEGREAVFDVVKENLWDIGPEGPGPIPQEVIQEALSPNPSESTLLRLAIAASDALIRVDEKLGGEVAAKKFGRLAQDLRTRLAVLKADSVFLRIRGLRTNRPLKELGGPFTSPDEVIAWIRESWGQVKQRHGVDADWIRLDFLSSESVPTRWVDLRETEWSPIQMRLNRLRHLMEENNPDPRAHPFWIVASWSVQPRGEKSRFIPVWEAALTTREAPASDQPSHLDLEEESLPPSTPLEGSVLSYEKANVEARKRLSVTLEGGEVSFFRIPPDQWVELTPDQMNGGGIRVLYEEKSSKYVRVALVNPVGPIKVPWIAVEGRKPGESDSSIYGLSLEKKGAQLHPDDRYGIVLQVGDPAKQVVLIRLLDSNRPVYLESREQAGLEEVLTFEERLMEDLKSLRLPAGTLHFMQMGEERTIPLVPGRKPLIVLAPFQSPGDTVPHPLLVDQDEKGEVALQSLVYLNRIDVPRGKTVLVGKKYQTGMFEENVSGDHLGVRIDDGDPSLLRVSDLDSALGTAVWIPDVPDDQFSAREFRWDLLPQLSLPGMSWNLMGRGEFQSLNWSPDLKAMVVLNWRAKEPDPYEVVVMPSGTAVLQSLKDPSQRTRLPSGQSVELGGLRMRWDWNTEWPARLTLENRDYPGEVALVQIRLTKIPTRIFYQGNLKEVEWPYQRLWKGRPTLIRWSDLSSGILVNLGGRGSDTWVAIRPSARESVYVSLWEREGELYSGFLTTRLHMQARSLVEIGRKADPEWMPTSMGVSRRHLEVKVTSDGVVLTDLNSRNGSYFGWIRRVRRMTVQELEQDLIPSPPIPPGATEVLLMPISPSSAFTPSGTIMVHPYLIATLSLEDALRKVLKEEVPGITFAAPSGAVVPPLQLPGFLVVEEDRSSPIDPWTIPILTGQTPQTIRQLSAALLAAQALYPQFSMEDLKKLLGNLEVVSASVIETSNGLRYLAIFLKEVSGSA